MHCKLDPSVATVNKFYDGDRKEFAMSKVPPFHSKKPGTTVHHNNDSCTEGNNIETYNRVPGTGGLPLCSHCRRLS